jgi:flagellar biosynthesis protein FlhG
MMAIAVTSGKGGVGKTVLAANLGIALSLKGQRVVLFDADLGLANLDIILGIKAEFTLEHVLDHVKDLSEVMVEGPGGTRVVAGGSGIGKLLRMSRKRFHEFLQQMSQLDSSTDCLIFDTGAGAEAKVITVLRCADEVVLVATPDPASIMDAYATAKVLFRHKPDAFIWVVVNFVTDAAQAEKVFLLLQSSTRRFLGKGLHYCGAVRQDAQVAHWVRQRRPFLEADPKLPASRDVMALADRLIARPSHQSLQGVVERVRSAFDSGDHKSA